MKKCTTILTIIVLAALVLPSPAGANPFMDVPPAHWAYDAVAQLAASGILSGYPDGTFKGAHPVTRYEMASTVARGLAAIDLEKASKQDVEMLKKLVVEFKDELDALGVQVDQLDGRVAGLEKNLGGWHISGELRFDANFGREARAGEPSWYADESNLGSEGDINLDRARLYITKVIDERTMFFGRIDGNSAESSSPVFDEFYVGSYLGDGWTLVVGRATVDWEGELGLYEGSNNGIFTDFTGATFSLLKEWKNAHLNVYYGADDTDVSEAAFRFKYVFNEHLTLAVSESYWHGEDIPHASKVIPGEMPNYMSTTGFYLTFNFTPAVAVKGLYYYQNQSDAWKIGLATDENTARAWRAILDVKQEALKFTSLWFEYTRMDNNFWHNANLDNELTYTFNGASLLYNQPHLRIVNLDPLEFSHGDTNTMTIYGVVAKQQWNDTWRTFAGFHKVNFNTPGLHDAINWTFGVGYRYSPSVDFELTYDHIDYGEGNDPSILTFDPDGTPPRNGSDNQIRLRTTVSF
jgi:hypothetical protein